MALPAGSKASRAARAKMQMLDKCVVTYIIFKVRLVEQIK